MFDNRSSEDTSLERMYKGTSGIDEDLFDALALLHSTERGSAEELRRMLDACIERKHGPGKTLAARMPKRFLQHESDESGAQTPRKRGRVSTQGRGVMRTEIWDGDPEIISLFEVDEAEDVESYRTSDVKMLEVEECREDERDIPRISIPDEGFADGSVCKVFFDQARVVH